MKLNPILLFLLSSFVLSLCGCVSPPRTGYDPHGLGMDSVEYMQWLFSLPAGPPLSGERRK